MAFRLAACVAACAAVGTGALARADAIPAPCVSTGMFATIAPLGKVPVPIGPSLAAADRQGTTVDAFRDARTASSIEHVELGVAGCVDANGTPGGTALTSTAWSVLGGAVSAVTLTADLVPQPGDGSGWRLRAAVDSLTVAGRPATIAPGDSMDVGDWAVLQSQATVATATTWWRAAFELRLTRAHDGFASGTRFLIGWVSADRRPAAAPTPPPPPKPKPKPTAKPKPVTTTTTTTGTPPKPHPKPQPHKKKQHKHVKRGYHPSHEPLRMTPPLGPGPYDFPVYGDVDWGDTYGGLRSDVPGGWHHGDDLFAALGRPVLAVADGTVFAVGWNKVGGWRLWLRDRWGNAFYYAHLAGYTALAKNNGHVRRGQVLGFVGNTGDAFRIDTHLHFEVHPSELLYLGYDGAVDPTSYLASWRRPDKVVVPPPVKLPTDHGRGQGSLTDYRRLLALRPLEKLAPSILKAAKPKAPDPVALGTPVAGASPSHRDGWAAAAAAVGLLLAAGLAVVFAARRGAQAS